MSAVSSALLWIGAGLPGGVVVGLQAHVELVVEESRRIGAVVGAAKLGADIGDHRILHQDVAHLRRELARRVERNCVGHGGANPQRAFVEMRHELSADEGNQQQRGGEDHRGHDHGRLGMVEAPVQPARIFVAHPFEGLVLALVHAFLNQ